MRLASACPPNVQIIIEGVLLQNRLFCSARGLDQRERAEHLVGLDHQRLVATKAGFGEQEIRLARQADLRSDAGGLIGLVAAAAEATAHPLLTGVEHRLDRIVDAAEIGGLDPLIYALKESVTCINASRILRSICAYGGSERFHSLKIVTAAMPTVSLPNKVIEEEQRFLKWI